MAAGLLASPSGLAPLVIPSTSRQIEALRAREEGVPLAPSAAQGLAARLGVEAADLAPVRLHDGPRAWALAAHFGQPVYAEGNDIFFQKGAYQPGTVQGRNLLGRQVARTAAVRAAVQRLTDAAHPTPRDVAHAPVAAQAPVAAAPHVPHSGDDRATLVAELTRLAAQASGSYTLLTQVLEADPLTGQPVPRPADATLATEILRLVPGGAASLPALQRVPGVLARFVAAMTDAAHLGRDLPPGAAAALIADRAAFLHDPRAWLERQLGLNWTPTADPTSQADQFFQTAIQPYLAALRQVAQALGPGVARDSGSPSAAVLPHAYAGPLHVLQEATLYGRVVALLGNRADDVTRYAVALDGQVAGDLELRAGHALRPLLAALAAPAPAPAGVMAALGGFLAAVGASLGHVPTALTDLLTQKARDLLAGLLGGTALAQLGDAVGAILHDPGAFLRNLGTALQAAIGALLTHVRLHIGGDLVSWLTGALGGAIPLPALSFADLGPAALTALIPTAQAVLGLDEAHLLDRIAAAYARRRHISLERARAEVVAAESRLGQLATLAQDTWAGLKQDPRQLVAELFDNLRGFVETALVQAALTKVAELAAPLVGEVIAAVQAVYSLVQTILDNAGALKAAFGVIVGQFARLAAGRDDALAASIGTGLIGPQLIQLIPGALTFLARFLQLEGIRDQLRALVAKVEGSIKGPLDHIVNTVVDRLVGTHGHEATATPAHPNPAHGGPTTTAQDKAHGDLDTVVVAGKDAVNARVAEHPQEPLSEEDVRAILAQVRATHHEAEAYTLTPVVDHDGTHWAVRGTMVVPATSATSPPPPHHGHPHAGTQDAALPLDGAGPSVRAEGAGLASPDATEAVRVGTRVGAGEREISEQRGTHGLVKKVGGQEVPRTVINYTWDGTLPRAVSALPLTKAPPARPAKMDGAPDIELGGSAPHAYPAGWKDVLRFDQLYDDKGVEKPQYWRKLHLLSQRLHGPGAAWNLVPGHATDNDRMERQAERKVKDLLDVRPHDTFYYDVDVTYRSGEGVLDRVPAWKNFPDTIVVAWGEAVEASPGHWTRGKHIDRVPFTLLAPPRSYKRSALLDLSKPSSRQLGPAPEGIGLPEDFAAAVANEASSSGQPFADLAQFEARMRAWYTAHHPVRNPTATLESKYLPQLRALIAAGKATFPDRDPDD